MPWVYVTPDPTPCKDCGYCVNGKFDVPDEVFEYTCPAISDPPPKFIPAEPLEEFLYG